MPRRKRVQQERKKVFCITAKKSVLRNYNALHCLLQLRMLLVNAPA